MSAAAPVRIALIGAGRMGRVHLEALHRSRAIEVAGVVEPVRAIRDWLVAGGLEVYAEVGELLRQGRAEAVLWGTARDAVFADAMQAQAEAFARAVRGGPREGAGGDDAVAAITVAERGARSLTQASARRRLAAP
jgi:predicted dehydrogenase